MIKLKDNALKHMMIDKDVKLIELSRATGIAAGTLSSIRNGKACSGETVIKICRALNCSLSDLVKEV